MFGGENMKKYLGFICFIYAFIILYVWLTDKMNMFLAPSMQLYIKITFFVLIVMGFVFIFNNDIHYKFKLFDVLLLLPLVLVITAGDGRFDSSFASNRMLNYKGKANSKVEKVEETVNDEVIESYDDLDFSSVDFEVIDQNYEALSDYLTYSSKAVNYKGKTVKVRGFIVKESEYLPSQYIALGKYLISCCAADANFIGFALKYDKDKVENDSWYEVEGVLERGKDKDKNEIMYINVVNIRSIEPDDEYVYPCYSYDDGMCSEVSKYKFE